MEGAETPAAALLPVTFYFLRHGETDWNARGLSQGSVDIPLNASGVAQAAAAASRLAGRGLRAIVSSDLSRARETARIVGDRLGITPSEDAGLREASFGAQEGQPMVGWYEAWVEEAFTPEGGESFALLRLRATEAVNRVLARQGPALIVAHGAMFRAVRSVMGLSPYVRAENGAAFRCLPVENSSRRWRLEPVT